MVACASLTFLFNSIAFADDLYSPDSTATVYGKTGLFRRNGVVSKITPTQWKVSYAGSNVTEGDRLERLTRLRAAQLALEKGFHYFRFQAEEKKLSCVGIFSQDPAIVPFVSANVILSQKNATGFDNAETVILQNTPTLSVDAPGAQKLAAFEDWRASCYQKYPPNKLRAGKMIIGVTDILVKGLFGI